MATEKHQNIQDPKKLRALAHPLRWKLIDLLTIEGQATATRCAQALNESVASCSYHLNTLAKYGYVEQAPGGRGQEKPWRMISIEQSWTTNLRDVNPDTVAAGEAASEAFLDYETARLKAALRRANSVSEPWRDANSIMGTVAFVTAEEAIALREEINALVCRYQDRFENPELRPEGHRAVRLFAATTLADLDKHAEG